MKNEARPPFFDGMPCENHRQVEDALAVINAHLGKLEKSFMEATEEKTRVEGQASACKERLGLAERCDTDVCVLRRPNHNAKPIPEPTLTLPYP